MSAPKFPAKEALQGRVGLVHQGSSSASAELEGVIEVCGLLVVEDVALAVVSGSAARRLVAEGRAPLDGKCLAREGYGKILRLVVLIREEMSLRYQKIDFEL